VKLELLDFVCREIILILAKGMTNQHQKGRGYFLNDPFFACATVDLEKFCHSTLLAKINNAVSSGPVFLALLTVGTSDAIH